MLDSSQASSHGFDTYRSRCGNRYCFLPAGRISFGVGDPFLREGPAGICLGYLIPAQGFAQAWN